MVARWLDFKTFTPWPSLGEDRINVLRQQVPTTPAFNPYPRSVQVGEFEVAIGGGIWVAIRAICLAAQVWGIVEAPNRGTRQQTIGGITIFKYLFSNP